MSDARILIRSRPRREILRPALGSRIQGNDPKLEPQIVEESDRSLIDSRELLSCYKSTEFVGDIQTVRWFKHSSPRGPFSAAIERDSRILSRFMVNSRSFANPLVASIGRARDRLIDVEFRLAYRQHVISSSPSNFNGRVTAISLVEDCCLSAIKSSVVKLKSLFGRSGNRRSGVSRECT